VRTRAQAKKKRERKRKRWKLPFTCERDRIVKET
jgi:hypothetical protein